jgi:hypothetical protein
MKVRVSHIMVLMLIFILFGCSGFEEQVIKDIRTDISKYDTLISTINDCDFSRFSNNQYIGNEYFPQAMKYAINRTVLKNKVEYLLMCKGADCEQIYIELVFGKLHLLYKPSPGPEFPKSNSYEEVGLIKRWGINRNWMIFENNDFLY